MRIAALWGIVLGMTAAVAALERVVLRRYAMSPPS